MKIGAYQFAVTKNITRNVEIIKNAILHAAQQNVKLLVFPECALTGYPPHDRNDPSSVSFSELVKAYRLLQELADTCEMHIICGTITNDPGHYYNSAIMLSPHHTPQFYHKRALWGWDQDHFSQKTTSGIFQAEGLTIGVRICFEVRFPEFFRELYREHTDLNVILFYDVADYNDTDRYELIRSHIRTRAVENVTHTLSVNTIGPYQTAPTALFDRSGHPLAELNPGREQLLLYDLINTKPDFGELGRQQISDRLLTSLC